RDDLDDAVGQSVFLEALALRALADAPGVCRLYDFGVTPTSYVLVLERCACSLNDWRSARSDNDEDDLSASPCAPRSDGEVALYLAVFRQVVAAVGAMAARGVIHFDLKCDNVLVRGGSSKTEDHECLASSPTAAGLRTGLAMEHEVVPSDPAVGAGRGESARGITTASDVWSLGCLLYELLCKQPLFRDLQWSEFFVTLTAGEGASVPPLPPPLSLRPFAALGCAKAVKTLLEAMLVRNPAERPSALRVVSAVD
ncbi:unnamed protein product, partial [Ectocarpus sp. 12 AP-2014]